MSRLGRPWENKSLTGISASEQVGETDTRHKYLRLPGKVNPTLVARAHGFSRRCHVSRGGKWACTILWNLVCTFLFEFCLLFHVSCFCICHETFFLQFLNYLINSVCFSAKYTFLRWKIKKKRIKLQSYDEKSWISKDMCRNKTNIWFSKVAAKWFSRNSHFFVLIFLHWKLNQYFRIYCEF